MAGESDRAALSPRERVILRLQADGHGIFHIATTLNEKPGTIHRIIDMMEYRGVSALATKDRGGLRPVERVVLRYGSDGESHGEIGNRIDKSFALTLVALNSTPDQPGVCIGRN